MARGSVHIEDWLCLAHRRWLPCCHSCQNSSIRQNTSWLFFTGLSASRWLAELFTATDRPGLTTRTTNPFQLSRWAAHLISVFEIGVRTAWQDNHHYVHTGDRVTFLRAGGVLAGTEIAPITTKTCTSYFEVILPVQLVPFALQSTVGCPL